MGAAATETLLPLPPPTPPRTHIVERGFKPARFIVSRSLSQRRVPLEKDGGECYQAAMNEVLTTPNKRSRLSALVPRRAVAKMAHGLQRWCQVGVAAVEKLSNVSVGRGASFFCSVSSNREWFEEASKKFRSFSRFFTFFRLAVDKPNEAEALDDPRETF